MSLTIGSWDVDYLRWYTFGINDVIVVVLTNGEEQYIQEWSHPEEWLDIMTNYESLIRVAQTDEFYTLWDDVNEQWIFNPVEFLPVFKTKLSTYRDNKISSQVTYTNALDDEFTVLNDTRTRAALNDIANAIPLRNDPIEQVNFKTVTGFKVMSVSDAQGLFKECVNWQQKCFDAEKSILDTHAITPYTDVTMAIPYAAFDDELEG